MFIWSGVDHREREFFNYRTKKQRRRAELEWEEWFIKVLKKLGWRFRQDLKEGEKTREYLLRRNLLIQLERFYRKKNNNPSFRFNQEEKSKLLRELLRERDIEESITLITDKRNLEVSLIDKENIENNHFEVVQQVEEHNRKKFTHIYDLVLMINGIPLVCIELKKATISNDEAFYQLKRYEEDRFTFETLSIFNNFQIFIATNFQRVSCFWKRDIKNLEFLQKFKRGWCNRDFFPQLKFVNLYFEPSRIVKQIFKKDTKFAKKRNSFWNFRPYFSRSINRNLNNFPNLVEQFSNDKRGLIAEAISWSFLISFFLLINLLSSWELWTILIGILVLFWGFWKRMWMYRKCYEFLRFFEEKIKKIQHSN